MKKLFTTVLSTAVGGIVGTAVTKKMMDKTVEEKEGKVDKFKSYYNLLNEWLSLKLKKQSLAQYFEKNNMKSVAIYGMGELGNRLYEELKDTNIEVRCGIDKNADNTFSELEVIYPDDEIPSVDVIVVTSIFAYEEIEEELSEKNNVTIISLEDVVYMA